MLAFVVPVKSRRIARSWDYVSRLFERTLRSLCAQTSREFRVIVVCHERPAINFDHPAVSYIEADWDPPSISDFKALLKDKSGKLRAGILAARAFAPTHAMAVDDCVSNRLAGYVCENSDRHGWYFETGYLHRDGSRRIFLKPHDFYNWCGTCAIVSFDWMANSPAPDGGEPVGFGGSSMKRRMMQRGAALEPLPFPVAVYVGTKRGEGTEARIPLGWHLNRYPKGALRPARKLFHHWFQSVPIAPEIAVEFGI
ncbi:MAG TPA: glycosyltransferase family A protein [Candidatus Binatia bacterium]